MPVLGRDDDVELAAYSEFGDWRDDGISSSDRERAARHEVRLQIDDQQSSAQAPHRSIVRRRFEAGAL